MHTHMLYILLVNAHPCLPLHSKYPHHHQMYAHCNTYSTQSLSYFGQRDAIQVYYGNVEMASLRVEQCLPR